MSFNYHFQGWRHRGPQVCWCMGSFWTTATLCPVTDCSKLCCLWNCSWLLRDRLCGINVLWDLLWTRDIELSTISPCGCAQLLQLCLTLCNPMDPPGPSVHGSLQERILERVAMPSSRGSSKPRDQTHSISCVFCIAGGFFTVEPPRKPHHLSLLWKNHSPAGVMGMGR